MIVNEGDTLGGTEICEYVFKVKKIKNKKYKRVGSAAPVENLSYSLICEKHCVTFGSAQNRGVITGVSH